MVQLFLPFFILVVGISVSNAQSPFLDFLKQKPNPVITRLGRSSGAPGVIIAIYGQSLNPPGVVRPKVVFESGLRSVLNPITVSDSKIEVRVPEGTGVKNVSVETASGVSNKVQFTYVPPTLKDIRPRQGSPEDLVTLIGENFGIKEPLDGSYVKFGKSIIGGARGYAGTVQISSWADKEIVVKAPSDLGTGTNDSILKALVGCLAGEGGLNSAIKKVVDIGIGGCDDLFNNLIKKYQLRVNQDSAEGPVPIVIVTSAGTSNGMTFTFQIGTTKAVAAPQDNANQTVPIISSSLKIFDSTSRSISASQTIAAGQTITAEFAIQNRGGQPITLTAITVGGRLGQTVIDFPSKTNITLSPSASYPYKSSLTLKTPGNYHFFTAYQAKDGQWNTAIPTVPGVTNTFDLVVSTARAEAMGGGQSQLDALIDDIERKAGMTAAQWNQYVNSNLLRRTVQFVGTVRDVYDRYFQRRTGGGFEQMGQVHLMAQFRSRITHISGVAIVPRDVALNIQKGERYLSSGRIKAVDTDRRREDRAIVRVGIVLDQVSIDVTSKRPPL